MQVDAQGVAGTDAKKQMNKALGDKMTAADRTRPDVIQIWSTLQSRALIDGVEAAPNIDKYLQEFQEESLSETRTFSPLEISAVKVMPGLTKAGQNKLAYHYQAYDPEHSAWPLTKLAADALRDGTKVARASSPEALPSDALQLWTAVYLPSPTKREAAITRRCSCLGQQRVGFVEPVVVEVLRTGYRWKGRVLRPAMVKVRG
jgi:hypothetical protein